MYRRRSRKRLFVVPAVAQSGHDLGAESVGGRVWSTWYVCMNAGARTWARMGSLCGAAGLGCFAVMAQYCVGVVELSATVVQRCMQRL